MLPLAPNLFSTTTFQPKVSVNFAATKRAMESVELPGPVATIKVIGFCLGKSLCANAELLINAQSAKVRDCQILIFWKEDFIDCNAISNSLLIKVIFVNGQNNLVES